MKWRIWLLSLFMTVICVLIFNFALSQVFYNSSLTDLKGYLRVYMNEYGEQFSLDEQGAKQFSEKLSGARVTFMDGQGKVLADSAAYEDYIVNTETADAIFNGEGFAARASSVFGRDEVYYCKNFDGKFLVRIAVLTDSDLKIFIDTLPVILQLSLIFIVFSAVTALSSARIIKKRIKTQKETR